MAFAWRYVTTVDGALATRCCALLMLHNYVTIAPFSVMDVSMVLYNARLQSCCKQSPAIGSLVRALLLASHLSLAGSLGLPGSIP